MTGSFHGWLQLSTMEVPAQLEQRYVNDAPVVTNDQDKVTVNEGQTANSSGAVSDMEDETVSLAASIGMINDDGSGTWSWSFGPSDGPAENQTVTITATDNDGAATSTTFKLVVNNVAPTVTMPLPGDPDGNRDAEVDTTPHQPIQHHPNITDADELMMAAHGWTDPVAKVTITRVSDDSDEICARLSGAGEVPPVDTDAYGSAVFVLDNDDDDDDEDGSSPRLSTYGATDEDGDENKLRFVLRVRRISGVTQAHIHAGLPNENGPVVAFFRPVGSNGHG